MKFADTKGFVETLNDALGIEVLTREKIEFNQGLFKSIPHMHSGMRKVQDGRSGPSFVAWNVRVVGMRTRDNLHVNRMDSINHPLFDCLLVSGRPIYRGGDNDVAVLPFQFA